MDQTKILKQLGLRIKAARKAKGLTQDEAAYRSGLARSYFGDIERGSRNVAVFNLYKIADALEVSVKDFFEKK